jgi:hypothetical protein
MSHLAVPTPTGLAAPWGIACVLAYACERRPLRQTCYKSAGAPGGCVKRRTICRINSAAKRALLPIILIVRARSGGSVCPAQPLAAFLACPCWAIICSCPPSPAAAKRTEIRKAGTSITARCLCWLDRRAGRRSQRFRAMGMALRLLPLAQIPAPMHRGRL